MQLVRIVPFTKVGFLLEGSLPSAVSLFGRWQCEKTAQNGCNSCSAALRGNLTERCKTLTSCGKLRCWAVLSLLTALGLVTWVLKSAMRGSFVKLVAIMPELRCVFGVGGSMQSLTRVACLLLQAVKMLHQQSSA